MDLTGLVAPETRERLLRAEAGVDVSRRLRIASLQTGDVGVLAAEVLHVAPTRTFRRKNGTEGLIGQVTLSDGTGEVDLVLWDGENQQVRDGVLRPGANVVLRGIAAKAGYRSGIELSLGAAEVHVATTPATQTLSGALLTLDETTVIDGRFQCQATFETRGRRVGLVAWDEAVKGLLDAGIGAPLTLDATPHPMLDDLYWVEAGGVHPAMDPTQD